MKQWRSRDCSWHHVFTLVKSGEDSNHLSDLTKLNWQAMTEAKATCCQAADKMRREESLFVLHCFQFCTQHKAQHNTCNHSSEGSWRTDGFALLSPSGCLAAESVYPFRWRDAATKGHRPLLGGAQEGCCVCADGSPCRYITPDCRVPTEPFERGLLPSWYSSVRCHCQSPSKLVMVQALGQGDGTETTCSAFSVSWLLPWQQTFILVDETSVAERSRKWLSLQ